MIFDLKACGVWFKPPNINMLVYKPLKVALPIPCEILTKPISMSPIQPLSTMDSNY